MPCRELDPLLAEGSAHHKLASVVGLGRIEEDGHGRIGAKTGPTRSHDWVVHVVAVGHARVVARKDGVGHPVGQHAETEGLVVAQARHRDADQQPHALRLGLHLQVVLHPRRGEARCQPPVHKGGVLQQLTDLLDLCLIQQLRNRQEHRNLPDISPADGADRTRPNPVPEETERRAVFSTALRAISCQHVMLQPYRMPCGHG